jgi:hypothetical protein
LVVGFGHIDFASATFEGRQDIVDVCGLWKEVDRPQFHRIDRGCDASEARENQDLNVGPNLLEVRDQTHAGPAGHSEIDDCQLGWIPSEDLNGFITGACDSNTKAPFLKCFRKPISQDNAVIDQENAGFLPEIIVLFIGACGN